MTSAQSPGKTHGKDEVDEDHEADVLAAAMGMEKRIPKSSNAFFKTDGPDWPPKSPVALAEMPMELRKVILKYLFFSKVCVLLAEVLCLHTVVVCFINLL